MNARPTSMPLTALPSRATVLPASERLDPYYDGLWAQGSAARWISAPVARAQQDAGLVKLPAHLGMEPAAALASMTDMGMRHRRLPMLSCVDAWRTMSIEQLAAMTGYAPLVEPHNTLVAEAFAASVFDLGEFISIAPAAAGTSRGRLVRPAPTEVFNRQVAPELSYAEWVRTTGGMPWKSGGQYDRHNTLTVELGLRIAEYCEVASVLGEKFASAAALTSTNLPGASAAPIGAKAADMVVVREDGVRIAVEMTASVSAFFEQKVARWAQILQATPWDQSGLMVVFVVASPPERRATVALTKAVRKVVAAQVRANPGSVRDLTAMRMAVVSWEDWFGARGQVDTSFLSLAAQRPTGPKGEVWETFGMLDVFDVDFQPDPDHDAAALATNSHLLLSTPHWLRDERQRPHLWPLALEGSGSMHVPQMTSRRPDRVLGADTTVGAGVAGDTRPPPRLDGVLQAR